MPSSMPARVDEAGLMPTVFGIGALLIGATTVFGQLPQPPDPINPSPGASLLSVVVILMLVRMARLLIHPERR